MLFILLYREFGNVFSLTGSKTLQETLIRFVVFLNGPRMSILPEHFPLSICNGSKALLLEKTYILVVPRITIATDF